MCLNNVKDKTPSIAEEDIPCFKVLRDYGSDGMYSPYQIHGPLKFGDLYQSKLGIIHFNQVNEGLHGMLTLESAKILASFQFTTSSFNQPFKTIIVNAVIPKGSEYYVGSLFTIEDGNVGIVANQMKYIDICVQ